jgi:phasin family protein
MAANATKTIETTAADMQKTVSEQIEKATKSVETATTFGQEAVDAMMKSQNIAAKAAEEIQAEVIAFSKKTVEEGVAHAKDLASAQTVTDFIEKQTGYAKATMNAFLGQTTKMNELVLSAVKDSFAPINARLNAASDLMKAGKA